MPKAGPDTPRARAKRDQIRAHAQRLFLARGFTGTSTDAIAAEAGVSKQTLYAYYSSKEELRRSGAECSLPITMREAGGLRS